MIVAAANTNSWEWANDRCCPVEEQRREKRLDGTSDKSPELNEHVITIQHITKCGLWHRDNWIYTVYWLPPLFPYQTRLEARQYGSSIIICHCFSPLKAFQFGSVIFVMERTDRPGLRRSNMGNNQYEIFIDYLRIQPFPYTMLYQWSENRGAKYRRNSL